jgi:MarR family transcriptional regulator, temperature-dependent positive regulator of motility
MDHSPLHLLHRAWQCAGEAFQQAMADGDLTPRQFAILSAVDEKEGLSQVDLVARTGIDRSTVTDLVQRMTRKGLLRRRRAHNDARVYALKLTEEGRRTLRLAAPLVQQVDRYILDTLPLQNRERFLRDLKCIMKSLGSDVGPRPPNAHARSKSAEARPVVGAKSHPSRGHGFRFVTPPRLLRQPPNRITP